MKKQMITMFLNKISEAIIVIHSKRMSDLASLDQHQKKAHVSNFTLKVGPNSRSCAHVIQRHS